MAPLVAYSDSDSDDRASPPPAKRLRTTAKPALPPLPERFYDLYAVSPRLATADDARLHAGRTRQVPHRAGNWPSHVFVEWVPTAAHSAVLDGLIRCAAKGSSARIHSSLVSDLGVPAPLHVSLSAPLILQTETKDDFLGQVTAVLSRLAVSKFTLGACGLQWAANQDASRWFLALKLRRPSDDQLNRILSACNDTASRFDQARLYEPSSIGNNSVDSPNPQDHSDKFHFSIGWTLDAPTADPNRQALKLVDVAVSERDLARIKDMEIPVTAVKVKIGSDITRVPLK